MNVKFTFSKYITTEFLYLSSFFLCLFCYFYGGTTFNDVISIKPLHLCTIAYMIAALSLKMVYNTRYSLMKFLVIGSFFALAAVSYYKSTRILMVEYILLLLTAKDIDPQKIIKISFGLCGIFLLVTFICSQLGIIVDYISPRLNNPSVMRHSFGVNYATDFAAHVFYLYMTYMYLKKRSTKLYDIAISAVIVLLLDVLCNARLSEIMILMTSVAFYYVDRKKTLGKSKLIKTFMLLSPTLYAAFVIILTHFYDPKNKVFAFMDDYLFSDRLSVGNKVINYYGYSIFGQNIIMEGQSYKSADFVSKSPIGTSYLDSSFLQIAMLYGFAFLAVMLVFLYIFTKKAYFYKDKRLILCIGLIAFSSIHNQYLINISYNPFTVAMGAYVLSGLDIKELVRQFKQNTVLFIR